MIPVCCSDCFGSGCTICHFQGTKSITPHKSRRRGGPATPRALSEGGVVNSRSLNEALLLRRKSYASLSLRADEKDVRDVTQRLYARSSISSISSSESPTHGAVEKRAVVHDKFSFTAPVGNDLPQV
eukprot:CFRG6660T1